MAKLQHLFLPKFNVNDDEWPTGAAQAAEKNVPHFTMEDTWVLAFFKVKRLYSG